MQMRLALGVVAMAATWLPAAAWAQALSCAVPQRVQPGTGQGGGERRVMPVTSYTLALSWSPGFCRQSGRHAGFQCGANNRFGFVLHGLWPDGRNGQWPQYCARAQTIPAEVVRQTLCVMPSAQLQWQQYAKHGTCSGMAPAAYFSRARSLYQSIRYPNMTALSRHPNLTAAGLAAAFARANAGMSPASIRIMAGRDGWLDEVRLCFDTSFRQRACPSGARGVGGSTRIRIWRGD